MENNLLLLLIKLTIFAHTFTSLMGIIIMVIEPNNRFISNFISKYKPYVLIEKMECISFTESFDYSSYIPLLSAKY